MDTSELTAANVYSINQVWLYYNQWGLCSGFANIYSTDSKINKMDTSELTAANVYSINQGPRHERQKP